MVKTKQLQPKKPTQQLVSLEELEREIQWRSWFPNIEFAPDGLTDYQVDALMDGFAKFCEANIVIKIPGKRIPMVLRDAQKSTLRDWIAHRKCICLKARQIGFSTLIANFSLWCAMGGGDRQIFMLSKGQREARALLSKARYAYRNLPEWVKDRGPRLLDKTLEKMTFENDSFLVSSQSASDPIRGETAWLAIVDEWASIPDQDAAWSAIEPTADLGGRIIGLSTAKGEGNFFHRKWVAAETGNDTFYPIFHSWRAVPGRDDAWYAEKLAENQLWFVHQEYPSTPEEAFVGSGNPFFDLDLLRDIEFPEPIGTFRPEYVGKVGDLIEDPRGDVTVWEKPSAKLSYVIGADVAMGLEHGDWSVAYVMEAKSQRIVAMYRGKCHPEFYGSQILPGLGSCYGEALICPEVNNHGLTTTTALKNVGYRNIYRRRTKLRTRDHATETIGFMTTSSNKPEMCDRIGTWLRAGNRPPDKDTVAELKTFVRDQSGNKVALHGSPWDDCVMALGLTLQAVTYALANNLHEPKISDEGTLSWWEKQLDKGKPGKSRLTPVM